VKDFTRWLLEAKVNNGFSHVVVIAGNHDITFEEEYYRSTGASNFHTHSGIEEPTEVKKMLTNETLDNIDCSYKTSSNGTRATIIGGKGEVGSNGIIYLEDGLVELQVKRSEEEEEAMVFNVFGTPYQPEFCNWAFNLDRGEKCKLKWDEIPACEPVGEDGDFDNVTSRRVVDVLLSHGPPLGRGDLLHPSGDRSGCVDLLHRVQNHVKPLVHAFGHIHEVFLIN
jgi:hypothetical protein